MKGLLADISGQLIAALLPALLIGAVLWYAWSKISAQFFGGASPSQVYNNTVQAAATIPSGLVSLTDTLLNGESESTYITTAQQKQMAQQNLQAALAGGS